LHEVESVTYEFPERFNYPSFPVFSSAETGFRVIVTAAGRGEQARIGFDVKATVHFKDRARAPLNLVHRLRLPE
jgi:hypothetical protein